MAGIKNDVFCGKNADFTQANAPTPTSSESNGLVLNGNLWIGSTSTNVGGTHINVGNITSPLSTLSIGYSSPNITIDVVGGRRAIGAINTQTGISPVVADASGIITMNGATVAAGTNPVRTDGTGANTLALEVQISQAIATTDATKIGLCNFNSAQFSVDANGFVSAITGAFKWNDVSGAFSPLPENGYFVTATATGTLPASPTQGQTIKFFVDNSSQFLTIQAAGSQIIRFGPLVSTAGGTAVSTQQGDSVELVYRTSDTCWCAINFDGTWIMA